MIPNFPSPPPADATVVVSVADSSQVGEARRAAAAMSARVGFNATRAGELAIIVTELANNLVRHGGGGDVLLRPISASTATGGGLGEAIADGSGIEVLAIDRGQGIANVNAAMRDGFSSGSTLGTGLGAVQRLSAFFDITSTPGRGTAIVSRVWPTEPPTRQFEIGATCIPVKGETVCGDAWCVIESASRVVVIVADGLGHGPQAAEASQLALAVFRENAARSPQAIVAQLHTALRSTRGAAASVAEIDTQARKVRFCGVGNVSASIATEGNRAKSLLSHNGTLGVEARRIIEVEQVWPEKALLILASDGITSRWLLTDYPGLVLKHPSLVSGVVYRDHRRGRDDATVLVVRG